MDKKNVLKAGVFTAIGLWVVPLFWDAVESFENVFKTIAMIVLGLSVVLFVGYDAIMPWFNKQPKQNYNYISSFDKQIQEIRKRVENNEISIEEGFRQEKKVTDNALELSKQQQELEKKKQQLKQIQGGNKKKGGGFDFSGLLGDSPKTGNSQKKSSGTKKQADKKPDMLDNVMGAVRGEGNERGVNISQQIKNSKGGDDTKQKKKEKKNKDNLDDLRDLF